MYHIDNTQISSAEPRHEADCLHLGNLIPFKLENDAILGFAQLPTRIP